MPSGGLVVSSKQIESEQVSVEEAIRRCEYKEDTVLCIRELQTEQ